MLEQRIQGDLLEVFSNPFCLAIAYCKTYSNEDLLGVCTQVHEHYKKIPYLDYRSCSKHFFPLSINSKWKCTFSITYAFNLHLPSFYPAQSLTVFLGYQFINNTLKYKTCRDYSELINKRHAIISSTRGDFFELINKRHVSSIRDWRVVVGNTFRWRAHV